MSLEEKIKAFISERKFSAQELADLKDLKNKLHPDKLKQTNSHTYHRCKQKRICERKRIKRERCNGFCTNILERSKYGTSFYEGLLFRRRFCCIG